MSPATMIPATAPEPTELCDPSSDANTVEVEVEDDEAVVDAMVLEEEEVPFMKAK